MILLALNILILLETNGNMDFIDALFTKPELRQKVEKLIDSESIHLVRKDEFSASDYSLRI